MYYSTGGGGSTNIPPYRNLLVNSIWISKNNILNSRGKNEYAAEENETNFKKAIVAIDNWAMGLGIEKVALSDTGGLDIKFRSIEWGMFYTRIPIYLKNRLANNKVTVSALVKGSGIFSIGGINAYWTRFNVDSDEYQLFTATYIYPSTDSWNQSVAIASECDINVGGLYFEEGENSTFCRFENGKWVINYPQIYNVEFQKMNHYIINLKSKSADNSIVGTGIGIIDNNINKINIAIPLTSSLYGKPVCQKTGDLYIGGVFDTGYGSMIKCVFDRVYSYSDNMLHIIVKLPDTETKKIVLGNFYILYARAGEDFIFSAETILL